MHHSRVLPSEWLLEEMDTVATISISVLSVLLAFTVGWQIWNAITLDLIRGRVRKEIDTANERSLQLEKHIKQIELQIERDNRIRFIFWESWEVLFGFEGCSVNTPHLNIRNTKIWFILCALKDISKLVNLSIPPRGRPCLVSIHDEDSIYTTESNRRF